MALDIQSVAAIAALMGVVGTIPMEGWFQDDSSIDRSVSRRVLSSFLRLLLSSKPQFSSSASSLLSSLMSLMEEWREVLLCRRSWRCRLTFLKTMLSASWWWWRIIGRRRRRRWGQKIDAKASAFDVVVVVARMTAIIVMGISNSLFGVVVETIIFTICDDVLAQWIR